MELLLVFYPSLALGACAIMLIGIKAGILNYSAHGEEMYELGKRHGREEAAQRVYRLLLTLL